MVGVAVGDVEQMLFGRAARNRASRLGSMVMSFSFAVCEHRTGRLASRVLARAECTGDVRVFEVVAVAKTTAARSVAGNSPARCSLLRRRALVRRRGLDGHAPAASAAQVEHDPRRDRDAQPAAGARGRASGIAQRAEERLLERILGRLATHEPDEVAEHLVAVLLGNCSNGGIVLAVSTIR